MNNISRLKMPGIRLTANRRVKENICSPRAIHSGCTRDFQRKTVESSGFVIIDSDFRPVYANEESIKILGYPNLYANLHSMDGVLTQKVFSFLPRDLGSSPKSVCHPISVGEKAVSLPRVCCGGSLERRLA